MAWGLLLSTWAVLTPVYEAPDELPHVDAAVRVALGEGWPAPGEARFASALVVTAEEQVPLAAEDRSRFADVATAHPGTADKVNQMTQHPPTYYLLAGGALRLLDFEDLRWDRSVLALRLLDVLLVLPLPLLVHATVRRTTGSPAAAAVAAVALFAVPQLAQVTSAVSNDALTVLLVGLVAWAGARVLSGASRRRDVVLLGALLGAALLVKGTALPAVPFVAVVLLVAGRGRLPLGRRLLRTGGALALAFVVGGWWWLRNLVLYGDVQPSGLADVRPTVVWPPGTTIDVGAYVDRFWEAMSSSFWGNFGLLEHPLSPLVTDVLTVTSLLLLVVHGFRRGRSESWALAALPIATLVMLVATTLRVYERTGLMYGIQGRYLFVALVPLLALAARAALTASPSPTSRRRRGRLVAWASLGLAAYGLLTAYRGFYEDQALLSRAGASAWLTGTPAGPVLTVAVLVAAVASALLVATQLARLTRPDGRTTREERSA